MRRILMRTIGESVIAGANVSKCETYYNLFRSLTG